MIIRMLDWVICSVSAVLTFTVWFVSMALTSGIVIVTLVLLNDVLRHSLK